MKQEMSILKTIFVGLAWLMILIGVVGIIFSMLTFLYIIGYYSLLLLPIIIFAYGIGWIANQLGLRMD